MPYRFIHTADIHLDSPLRSLALRNGELAELIGHSTRKALVSTVDLCLEEQVDALVIAGDLYDGDQTSMKTARFLATELERLHAAGISVFIIRGNHDALSRITQELVFPPNVTLFGGRADVYEVKASGLSVAIHGLSFSRPQAPESLLPRYKAPVPDAANIGIMHTSLAGAPGHDVYAPCSVADLMASGYTYWGLGHIHQRSAHQGDATVVMPGMPQGRDINEAGAKTISLVTIADDRTVTVEEKLTSIAQFERVNVSLQGVDDWRDATDKIELALARQRENTISAHLIARLRLTGETPLSFRLRRDIDLIMAEAEQRGERIGQTWIEKLELDVHTPGEDSGDQADPVIELEQLMRRDVIANEGFRDEIRDMVRDMISDLPAESRRFAGEDEEGFDRFLDGLLDRSAEEITARLSTAERDDS